MPALARGDSPERSARKSVAVLQAQVRAARKAVLRSDDPEHPHHLRIAVRKLRNVLRAHRKVVEPAFLASAHEGLRWIASTAGAARDLDVLASATVPAMARDGAKAAEDLVRKLRRRRSAARSRLRTALRSPRALRCLRQIDTWVASEPARVSRVRLDRFAGKALDRVHRRFVRRAARLASLDAAGRHEARIAARRLRDTAQCFAPLYRDRDVDAYLEAVEAVQHDLGRANDAAVAGALLASLDPPRAFARLAREWLASETRAALRPLAGHLERLGATPRFWKRP